MRHQNLILMRLVLLLFLIGMFKAASAQTWPMPGAKWTYCITSGPSPAGSTEMTVTGDTVIDGTTYTIIDHPEDDGIRTLYTRFSNDTVYRYVNSQEYLYFSYNLEVGDVYTTYRSSGFSWSDSACNSVMPLKVISSQMVEYGGQTLQQWTLRDTLFNDLYGGNMNQHKSQYGYQIDYKLVERIGVINSYPLINPREPSEGCNIPTDVPTYSLGTYEDDSFYHMFEACEGSGIGDGLQAKNKIRITPNPARDFFEIEFLKGNTPREYEVRLYDVTGHAVLNKQVTRENGRIDVSGIKPGFYLIRLKPINNKANVIVKSLVID